MKKYQFERISTKKDPDNVCIHLHLLALALDRPGIENHHLPLLRRQLREHLRFKATYEARLLQEQLELGHVRRPGEIVAEVGFLAVAVAQPVLGDVPERES